MDVFALLAARPTLITYTSSSSVLIEEGSGDPSTCLLPSKNGPVDIDSQGWEIAQDVFEHNLFAKKLEKLQKMS